MNAIKDLEEKLFFLEEEIKKTENYLEHQKYVAERYRSNIQKLKQIKANGEIATCIDG
jgi:hypothetical protein